MSDKCLCAPVSGVAYPHLCPIHSAEMVELRSRKDPRDARIAELAETVCDLNQEMGTLRVRAGNVVDVTRQCAELAAERDAAGALLRESSSILASCIGLLVRGGQSETATRACDLLRRIREAL